MRAVRLWSGRGIEGFRNCHQIPFLSGTPDRGQYIDEITYHYFGGGLYAAVTGWLNMIQTVTHDGWPGIAPTGRKITMRSLDFLRIENGLITENWVIVTCSTPTAGSASTSSYACASSIRPATSVGFKSLEDCRNGAS